MRAPAVEQALQQGDDPSRAAQRVLDDVEHTLRDDPLASAWYRAQLLPRLVARALADLQETR